jgi:hypothetical protein
MLYIGPIPSGNNDKVYIARSSSVAVVAVFQQKKCLIGVHTDSLDTGRSSTCPYLGIIPCECEIAWVETFPESNVWVVLTTVFREHYQNGKDLHEVLDSVCRPTVVNE